MNLRRRSRASTEVFSASLNDIMFFLLLFFLITSTMATPNVLKLLLPNAKSSNQGFKHPLTISVTEDLQYALLKVDKTVQVQNLVDLLDIGNRLKIKMVLATQTSKK